tara:strand:+ start:34868 stop:35758 length:891 start_codon:yes stop_codon:yes gene_type:complete
MLLAPGGAHKQGIQAWPQAWHTCRAEWHFAVALRRGIRTMRRPMTSRVLSERRGDAVLVTLNAPERRNAIDQEMVDGLHAVLDELEHDETVAAIVLTGAGEKAFAAGADIAQLRDRTSSDALKAINSSIFNRIEEFAVPVIAAVKGYALGGGCELAIACDLRVLGESAKMGQPEVKLGIIPAAGGTYRLPRLIGLGLARELVYTGRMVAADEAQRIGLANKVVPDAEVVDAALAMADEIAKNGRLAVRAAKRSLNALSRPGHENAVVFESSTQAVLFDSDDKKARMDAFLSKQKKR